MLKNNKTKKNEVWVGEKQKKIVFNKTLKKLNYKTIQTKRQFYISLIVSSMFRLCLLLCAVYFDFLFLKILFLFAFFQFGKKVDPCYGVYFDDEINDLEWLKDRLFDVQKVIDLKKDFKIK